jgi:hypothetical protein
MKECLLYREEPSQYQIEVFRSWDNVRKMRCMFEMYELAKHRLRMAVRARHPDWDDEEVERRVRELVTGQPLVKGMDLHNLCRSRP